VVGGGYGGDSGDSGFSDDEISNALGLRSHGNEMLYALPSGQDCVVTQILTSSDEVKSAQEADAGAVDAAVANNPAGDAGVEFCGETGPTRTSASGQPKPTSARSRPSDLASTLPLDAESA
jgi:hypothetical protein